MPARGAAAARRTTRVGQRGGRGHVVDRAPQPRRAPQQRLVAQVLDRQPGGRDQHEPLDPRRERDRHLGADEAAHRVADDVAASMPELGAAARRPPSRSPGSRSARPRHLATRRSPAGRARSTRCESRERRDVLAASSASAPPRPWTNTQRRAPPPMSTTLTSRSNTRSSAGDRASRCPSSARRHRRRTSRRRGGLQAARSAASAAARLRTRHHGSLPYQRPCGSPSTSTPRCTTTGTSSRRPPSGASASTCPYERPAHVGHRAAAARAGRRVRRRDPPRATRARRRAVPRRGRGDHALARGRATSSTSPSHRSDRRARRHRALARADRRCPTTSCYCSYDKVSRCREIGIDVLIDDSPGEPAGERAEAGITAATLVHPWNRELLRGGGRRLRRRLAGAGRALDAARWRPVAAVKRPCPAPVDARRRARCCPAIEPERQVTDWGRSERVEGLIDRTLYDFLYHLWFRCEVEGIENVPASGGALLVSNHARRAAARRGDDRQGDQGGAPAPAAAAPDRRALLQGLPRASACWCRSSAACPRTRPTSSGCCYDEEQLVLVFPEGRKGTEKLYKDRYRLRRFGRGGFVEAAMRARAPIVPVAVVGAEEAMPIFAHVDAAPAPHRPDLLPDHADCSRTSGCSASATCRPSSGSASWSRSRPTGGASGRGRTAASSRRSPRTIRARIQEELFDMVAQPPVGVVRMTSKRVLITGLSTYWGGRLAQALEQDALVETIIGIGPQDPTLRARAHRVRPRRPPARAAAPDRPGGRDRHGRSTRGSSSTRRGTSPRVAHENNVIGTMNILAACGGPDSPVRKVVFKSSAHYYGCEHDDPAFFTEAMAPPAPAAHADRARHRRGREGRRRTSPSATRRSRSRSLRFANGARAGHRHLAHRAASACPRCRASSASTRATSSSTRTTSSACSSTRPRSDLPGRLQRRGRRRARAVGGRRPARQAARADPAAVGDGAGRPRPLRRLGVGCRTRCSTSCATAAGSTTAGSRRPATATRYTTRETVLKLRARRCAPRRCGAARRAVPLRARGRGVPALQPERAPRAEREPARQDATCQRHCRGLYRRVGARVPSLTPHAPIVLLAVLSGCCRRAARRRRRASTPTTAAARDRSPRASRSTASPSAG